MKAVKDGFLALDTALVCPLTIPLLALELECLDWTLELIKHKTFLDEVADFVGLSSSGAGSIRVEARSIAWKMAGIQRQLLEAKKWTRGLEEATRALQEVSMMLCTDKDGWDDSWLYDNSQPNDLQMGRALLGRIQLRIESAVEQSRLCCETVSELTHDCKFLKKALKTLKRRGQVFQGLDALSLGT